jgi:hypothetical protein
MSEARFTGKIVNLWGSNVGRILEDVSKRELKFLSAGEWRVGARVSYIAVPGSIDWLAADLRKAVHETKA